jgi:Protein of unknown function (DUF2933)
VEHEHQPSSEGPLRSNAKWVLLGFLAIAAFFLLTEHRAHVLGFFPFLLLLACPLMHIFMHRGHGGHAGHPSGPPSQKQEDMK